MIQVYLPSNTDYEHNGDMTLFPSSASVHAILNGSWEAELVHPIDQEGRWKFIQQEGVVSMPSFYENSTTLPQMQLFRIKSIDKSDTEIVATMEPIFYDAMDDCFLTDVRPTDKNGQQALDILCAVNTKYSGKSNITRTSTAYYQYKNLLEALNGDNDNSFVSRWGGEMLFNSYEVIINDRVGIDAGYELRYGKNMPVNGLTESVDIRDVVTRIYPKAYNGREMSNHGYVDSELIDSYPTVKAVTMTFDNVKLAEDANADDEENGVIICDTQAELDQALTEQCEAQFASGVDKPKVTISANLVILKYSEQYKEYSMLEDVSLGDTIHCINSRLGIETSARVIELEYDSLRKKVESVVIGDYQYNYFYNVTSSVDKIEQIVLPNGNINAAVVQGIINAANAQFKIQNTAAQKVEQRAILFEDLDPDSSLFGALSIGTQGIQIAHERTADGRDWDWGTAINYRMINADYIIAGTITDQKASNFWNLNTGEFRLSASTIEDNSLATIGETIASVDVEYASGTSDTEAPADGWSTTAPAWQEGRYIWQRTVTTMADGTKNISDPTCIQGAAGESVSVITTSVTYAVSSSGVTPPSTWSETIPDTAPGQYLWSKSETVYSDGKETVSYGVSYQGENGSQGVPGPPGEDGQTLYTWIKYADTPTSGISDSPDGKKYLGIAYNKESPIESDNYEDYQWSDIKGKDGIPGTPGENGETLYTWIKYATDASGSGMSDSPEGCSYIGIAYNKESPEESDSPTDYAWSLIQGEAGIGVENVVEEYYLSTSSTEQTDGEWSTDQPEWVKGRYIWTRSKVTWTDGSITYTDPVLAKAINGANEAVGDLDDSLDQEGVFNRLTNNGQTQGIYLQDGLLYINGTYIKTGILTDNVGKNYWNLNTGEFRLSATSTVGGEPIATQNNTIASVDVEYAVGDSDATAPTTGWSTASPQWQAGKYIWQRTVTTMQDGTQNTSEPTCIQGAAGQNGADGTDGKDGQDGAQGEQGVGVESVADQYYLSNSPTEPSGGFWSETQPAWKLGFYIWTRSVVTYTDGNTEETEPILAQAINSANQSANDANQAVTELDNELDQQGVFNRLTNNGQTQGIYLSDGKLYINATYIATGKISSVDGKVYFDLNSGTLVANEIVGTEEGSTTNGKIGMFTYSSGEKTEGFSVATTSGNGGRISMLISRTAGNYTLANDIEIMTTGNLRIRSNAIATNPGGNNTLIFQGNSSSGQGLIRIQRGKPGGSDNVLYVDSGTTNLYGVNSQLVLFSNSSSTALCFNGNQAINIAQSQIDIRYSGSYVYIVSASNNYVRVGHWSGDASVIMRNNMIDFSVTGYLRASINSDGSASFGTIYSNGNVVTSERSKKKDILPLEDGAIEKVKASGVYKYSLREERIKDEESDNTKRTAIHSEANEEYIGIMYDEAPEELRKENIKGQKGIDLYSMVSLLWKAVQELNDKIERIKSES